MILVGKVFSKDRFFCRIIPTYPNGCLEPLPLTEIAFTLGYISHNDPKHFKICDIANKQQYDNIKQYID